MRILTILEAIAAQMMTEMRGTSINLSFASLNFGNYLTPDWKCLWHEHLTKFHNNMRYVNVNPLVLRLLLICCGKIMNIAAIWIQKMFYLRRDDVKTASGTQGDDFLVQKAW